MQSKGLVKILSLLLSLSFAFSSALAANTALAASQAELQQKKQKIQQEIQEAQKKVNELAAEKKETQEYVTALDKKIMLKQDEIDVLQQDADALQAQINEIEQNISDTEAEIDAAQKEIDKKQAAFDETYAEYCQRLRAMYVSGHASNIEVLLTCPDISSILTRSQMIKSVSEQDSEVLNSLMEQMAEIESQKAELQEKRIKLAEDKETLETDKAELESEISEIESAKQELNNELAELKAVMSKLSSQQNEYMELIEEDQAAVQQVENDIRAAIAAAQGGSATNPGIKGTGQLGYPTDYRTISAGFPNYSSGRYHGGVDFPCPTGSNVYAADGGVVILVKYLNYSYGYHVMIDHGNGIQTLYAHNSAILVSPGQTVTKGQIIAKSGSTGNSTGPHCHFEVRLNGTQVNPLAYL